MVNNFLVALFVFSMTSTAVAARSLKKNKKSKQIRYPKYTETPGYHRTGNYMVFTTYADSQCSENQLKEIHGYALGVCQPFTTPGLWWMNYAGTSSEQTFLMYQYFTDEICTKPASTPLSGFIPWPNGCNNRDPTSKTFNVQDKLPSFAGGTLLLQYVSEAACKANKLDAATGFEFAKPGKCTPLFGNSMFINLDPTTFYGVIFSCSSNGAITASVYNDNVNCASGLIQTKAFTTGDYCVAGTALGIDILGYVNVQCV